MSFNCEHWKEYDSISGPISYCEIAAFGHKLSLEELEKMGCTAEKRKVCKQKMEFTVGDAATPKPEPQPAPVVVPNICDTPKAVAATTVGNAEKKAVSPFFNLLVLGILAGCYIALAGALSTVVTNDLAAYVGDGLSRLVGGLVFSLGLILVVIGGAELFTGNTLMVTGWLEGKISGRQVARNWTIVYFANFLGAILIAWFFYLSGIWEMNGTLIGAKSVMTASGKVNLTWTEALVRGILCNWLVCLAVWLASGSKDGVSKILCIVFPITAFVACGFEHSIANMFFIPTGILLKGQASVLSAVAPVLGTDTAGALSALANLNWSSFVFKNLIPVTIGNIIGGAIFVGTFYWSVFLKPASKKPKFVVNLAGTLTRLFTP
ncbi:MAG: formate/nitrite transporter family protein [Syntrophaceticus sp.]|jgi:formate/nitrite transporter